MGAEASFPRIQVGHEKPKTQKKDMLSEKLAKRPRFDRASCWGLKEKGVC